MSSYFNLDRFKKYGYGSLRLLIIVLLSFCLKSRYNMKDSAFPMISFDFDFINNGLYAYYKSFRWAAHVYIGIIGAIVNVKITNFYINTTLLVVAGCFCIYDVYVYVLILFRYY